MKRDEAIKRAAMRRQDKGANSFQPLSAPSGDDVERTGRTSRPRIDRNWQPVSEPLPPLKMPASAMPRRGPTYPAWERPPTAYDFPTLRGREQHRTLLPIGLAALGVAVVLVALVIIPALLGHGGNVAAASTSPSSAASGSSQPSHSAGPSPSATGNGTPTPYLSYAQYKVVAGDSAIKIAKKFGLQPWELYLANPQLTPPNYSVRLGAFLNIPQPGQLTPSPVAPSATPTPAAP